MALDSTSGPLTSFFLRADFCGAVFGFGCFIKRVSLTPARASTVGWDVSQRLPREQTPVVPLCGIG